MTSQKIFSKLEQANSLSLPNRFNGFDILKFIYAFFAVCIHTPFPGVAGEYFTALARIAVPIFFMITDFYFSDVLTKRKCATQKNSYA